MAIHNRALRVGIPALLALGLLLPATTGEADDSDLFTTVSVDPNVLVLIDNSASMNHIIWHPSFDANTTYDCNLTTHPSAPTQAFDPNTTYLFTADVTVTVCNRTRTIFHDNKASQDPFDNKRYTRYDGRYLNWLFSSQADTAYTEISANNNGFPSSCVGGTSFAKYQRTRMNVAKQVLKDVVCQVNLVGNVRFGIAVFRNMDNSGADDPNGGYVIEPIDTPTSNQQADLVSAIQSISADTFTPLGEALFQSYTYYMPRVAADMPSGVSGTFPLYEYNTSSSGVGGNYSSNGNGVPPDPVQYSCQKNFVIIVTDGEPTKDDFDVESPTDTTAGYANFTSLIGNYNSADGETEVQADLVCTGCETALYLDDIAKFMQENDFRPDMPGIQVIDTYAIGFSASPGANTLLAKTASVGNGIFFAAKDEAALAQAIIDSLSDIIEKAQSFTAATVPASRTAAGDHLYVSLFTPTSKTPYWNGRLRSYRLTVDGEVEDANGNCALDDPSGNCFTGTFLPTNTNPPFWDAATAVPAAFSRDLMTSRINSGTSSPEVVDFKHTADSGPLAATDLGVTTFPPTNPYTGSIATDAEELTAEIIASVRGCDFGTGANSVACVSRANRLSDIFHANPVVVGQPAAYFPDQTYKDWVANISGDRDRVIFAGSNGGFLHGFNAGTWNSAATPPVYTAGDGAERFGFMPWSARQNIANLPNDTGNRDYYFVDGSPSVADAWLWTTGNANQATPSAQTQWRTVLVSGMRQGGHSYFALDVTEPGATSCAAPAMGSKYPCYLWEFPREDDSGAFQALVGETWGDPIITRIKLDVNGTVVDRWVAVVTGGYHATGDPNDHASYDPNGTLGRSIWILDLSTGEPLAMRSVDLSGSGCSAAYDPANPELHMCYAFAATPAVYDIDGDGYSDMIVAVDLGGQVWKWVINGVGWDPNNTTKTLADNDTAWPLRKFFEAPIYQASGGSPKFYKSLFHAPAATLKSGTLWYAFGSGERNELLHAGDSATTADNNRMYSMKDVDPLDAGSPTTVLTESNLTNLTAVTGCPDLSAVSGFYFVGAEGEKWVTEFDLFSYWVLASSYIPVPSNDPCTIGGAASLYAFRVYCGDGFFPGPSGTTTRSTSIGGGLPTDPKVSIAPGQNGATRVIISKQGGEIENVDFGNAFGPGIGVFYWRELQN